MSSRVMTWMADAVFESGSGRRDTELTSMAISCSRLTCLSAPGESSESGVCADARLTRRSAPSATWTGSSLVARRRVRGLGEKLGMVCRGQGDERGTEGRAPKMGESVFEPPREAGRCRIRGFWALLALPGLTGGAILQFKSGRVVRAMYFVSCSVAHQLAEPDLLKYEGFRACAMEQF